MISAQYIAGFFDADGSVGIYKRGKNSWQLNIAIANSGYHGLEICTLLQKQFGGCLSFTSAKKRTHRNAFWWKLNGCESSKAFLLYIEPFVIIKKDQVKASLDFIEQWSKMPKHNKTIEQIDYLKQSEMILKEMKRKC